MRERERVLCVFDHIHIVSERPKMLSFHVQVGVISKVILKSAGNIYELKLEETGEVKHFRKKNLTAISASSSAVSATPTRSKSSLNRDSLSVSQPFRLD